MLKWLRFNLWYYRRPPWDTGVTPPELLAFLRRHPPGRALDLGCGSGVNLAALARHGWQAIGVDYALPAVWRARRRLRAAGLPGQARLGDVTRLPGIAGPFDLVLDIGCYHGLDAEGRSRYQANLRRLLSPGGTWLLYAHLNPGLEPANGRGLGPRDVAALEAAWALDGREDGADQGRPSAWFTWRRSAP
jgi:SAM-dependent methyltransferase